MAGSAGNFTNFRTTGQKGLDDYLRLLEGRVKSIEAKFAPSSFPPAPSVSPTVQGGKVLAKATDGSYNALVSGLEFVSDAGFGLSQDGQLAKVDLLLPWDYARITSTSPALTASRYKLYLRVFDDGTTGRTLTLPDPTLHRSPIWVRSHAAPAGGHTLKRFGSEKIDGASSDLTMGNTAGQVDAVMIFSDGTDWYTLSRNVL